MLRCALTLPHDNAAHEYLNRPHTLQRHFALSCRLPHAQLMPKILLADSVWVIYLVSKYTKWDLA